MSKELIERLRNTTYHNLDPYEAADRIEQLRAQLKEAQAEAAHWKNNHETEVRRARILKERTDMPIERVDAYEQWGKDQMALKEAQEAAEFNFKQYQDAGRLLCEAQAEIERLRRNDFSTERLQNECFKLALKVKEEQLAASQADNARLREAGAKFMDSCEECTDCDGFSAQMASMDDYHEFQEALSMPTDNSAEGAE